MKINTVKSFTALTVNNYPCINFIEQEITSKIKSMREKGVFNLI